MAVRTTRNVALAVNDVAAATEFYVDQMGFEVVEVTPDWTELRSGVLRFFLCRDDPPGYATFEVQAADVPAASAALIAAGCQRFQPDRGGEVFLQDPFGIRFCVSRESPISPD
ncbi:MAG: VOC family protein [Fimbriimonadaceae bacterium]